MSDITIIKLASGIEVIGKWVSNPLNKQVRLEEALHVSVQPSGDGQVEIGLGPLSVAIAMEAGVTGHPFEAYPEQVLMSGMPVPQVLEAYLQATSRIVTAPVRLAR